LSIFFKITTFKKTILINILRCQCHSLGEILYDWYNAVWNTLHLPSNTLKFNKIHFFIAKLGLIFIIFFHNPDPITLKLINNPISPLIINVIPCYPHLASQHILSFSFTKKPLSFRSHY
jgi:hypothetical protein